MTKSKHTSNKEHYKHFKSLDFIEDILDRRKLEFSEIVALGLFEGDLVHYLNLVFKHGSTNECIRAGNLLSLIYDGIDSFAEDLERKKGVPKGLTFLKLYYPDLKMSRSDLNHMAKELSDVEHRLMMAESKLAVKSKPKKLRKYL